MTTLYYKAGACSLAPHIVLEWIGAPYAAKPVAFGSAELLSLNPAGRVPVLREDDGWTLTQAGAILAYLARKHPEAGLGPDEGPRAQAEADRWSSFIGADLHGSFWPIFRPSRYTTDESEAATAAVGEAGAQLVARRLQLLDDHLAGRDWILGAQRGRRSILDAYVFPMLQWAGAKLPGGIARWQNVTALHDRLAADPQVKAVLAAEAKG